MARNSKKLTRIADLKIDGPLRRRYERIMVRLRRAMRASSKHWYAKYTIVASIFEGRQPAYLAGGYATEGAFIDDVLKESRSVVYRSVRVVKFATAAQVAEYSATRIDGAIWYAEAKRRAPLRKRADIDFATMEFPVVREGLSMQVSLLEITHAELREAIVAISLRKTSASAMTKAISEAVARSGVEGVNTRFTKTHLSLRAPIKGVAAIGRELARVSEP